MKNMLFKRILDYSNESIVIRVWGASPKKHLNGFLEVP
jgi:hypothetical protein